MKRFSKLLAVVLAIAVIICPMMSVVSHATTTNGYKIEAIDENNLKLTISSTDGFVAYHATVGFNSDDAFQSNYTDATTGYTNGLKVISYTLKTEEANDHNAPAISANASGTSLNVIVMPSDINNLDLCTEIVIGIRVASGATATLTKIQAADNGTVDSEDANLLTFPAANESTGEIDQTAEYAIENATTVHTHDLTLVPANDPTCTDDGNYAYYTCSGCDKIFSDSQGTNETTSQAVTRPATGHSFTNYVSDGNATCTADGTKTAKCDNCDETDTVADVGSATGHSFTNYVSDGNATCTQDGTKTAACDRECGVTDTITDVGSHETGTHTPAAAVTENEVAATCTTAGSYDTVVYCSACGDELSRETVIVQATGVHTADDPVEENRVEATCGVAGSYDSVVYCSVCNTELSRNTIVIPATGNHTWGEWTTDADGHSRTCSVCNTVDSGTHDGSPCSVCGYEAAPAVQLNTSITDAVSINIGDVIRPRFLIGSLPTGTEDFYVTFERDSVFTDTENGNNPNIKKVQKNVYKNEFTAVSGGRYYYYFSDIALYELSLEISATVHCLNEQGVEFAYSTTVTTTLATLAKAQFSSTTKAKTKTLMTDMLNLGAQAQLYLVGNKSTSDLAEVALPNADFSQEYATAQVSKEDLNNVNVQSTYISNSVNIGAVPRIRFLIQNVASYQQNDLRLVCTYHSAAGQDKSFTIAGEDLTPTTNNRYLYYFSNLALYDINATVTTTLYAGEVELGTSEYSMESYVYTNYSGKTSSALLNAMASFCQSARDYIA